MNTLFMNPVKITVLACVTVFLSGCAKNSVVIEYGKEPESNSTDSSSGNSTGTGTLVTFHASVENRNMTRAMSPMGKGIQNQIFAYSIGNNGVSDAPTARGLYTTSSPGVLTGNSGYKMYLPNGNYNFYAVSSNSSAIPPTFTNNQSEPLTNGIDYLWYGAVLQDVNSSQIDVPIVYFHEATQVVFDISAGNGIKLDKLVSATLTPSQTGGRMYLYTGDITAASTYGTAVNMGINDFTAQYTMLPLNTTDPMTLTFEVLADGQSTSRTYTAQLSLPDGRLRAGNSYLFSAVIDGNQITFPSVSIRNWREVDETGKPIYPVQD